MANPNMPFLFVFPYSGCPPFLKTGSHYIVHAGLEIAVLCLSFLFVVIIDVFYHAQLVFLLKFPIKLFFSTLLPPQTLIFCSFLTQELSLVSFIYSGGFNYICTLLTMNHSSNSDQAVQHVSHLIAKPE